MVYICLVSTTNVYPGPSYSYTELHIGVGIEVKSKPYIFLDENICCDPSLAPSRDESVLMVGHKICFMEKYG